jgi:hypothetical protein
MVSCEYGQGTVIVDVVQPQTRALMGRGLAQVEVDLPANPEKPEEKLNEALRRMFEAFPPE